MKIFLSRSTRDGEFASALQGSGKLEEAMALLKKQEALCLEVGLKSRRVLRVCPSHQIKFVMPASRTQDA